MLHGPSSSWQSEGHYLDTQGSCGVFAAPPATKDTREEILMQGMRRGKDSGPRTAGILCAEQSHHSVRLRSERWKAQMLWQTRELSLMQTLIFWFFYQDSAGCRNGGLLQGGLDLRLFLLPEQLLWIPTGSSAVSFLHRVPGRNLPRYRAGGGGSG